MTNHKSPFLASTHDYMLPRLYAKRTIETYIYWVLVDRELRNNISSGQFGRPIF